jgi:cyclophilin family peptidyl-prolyl cis-trans isomerase
MVAEAKVDKTDPNWRTKLPRPHLVTFDPTHAYLARMVTNKGVMRIRLRTDYAPMHVTNFAYLARLGFYDGLRFHRVIKRFVVQGGDPIGDGTGGPGYYLKPEIKGNLNGTHDAAGRLSAANAGPGTDGSQFFLTCLSASWLNGKHIVFGEVAEGMKTLRALEDAGSSSGDPSELLLMEKVTIEVAERES